MIAGLASAAFAARSGSASGMLLGGVLRSARGPQPAWRMSMHMAWLRPTTSRREYQVLVLNAGSSSLKFALFSGVPVEKGEKPCLNVWLQGIVERIGDPHHKGKISHGVAAGDTIIKLDELDSEMIENHHVALDRVLELIRDEGIEPHQVKAVGHRVVHGGDTLTSSCLITDTVEKRIEEACQLAPLHNPKNLEGIRIAKKVFNQLDTKHVAVFDTAFHASMPPEAFLYALPIEWYEKYRVRKYGMHGTSYAYILSELEPILDKHSCDVNAIICHLGAGSSMACVKEGKCIDTTMGMTPLEGLVMATRCGDLDAGILPYIASRTGLGLDKIEEMLNKNSGLLGLCGEADLRYVLERVDAGDKNAVNAYHALVHRIRKYLGAYVFNLEGQLDAVVFTAGMGQHSARLRRDVLAGLDKLGLSIDDDKNENGEVGGFHDMLEIHSDNAACKILAMMTKEELQIARECALVAGIEDLRVPQLGAPELH
ncbi:Acetate kinase [Porphyridium purpureum]|uniref:Probable acetate kinase n=1 Tax=Porphyridium purpureum TaxID=35688 RepID=A0A5J4Z201_PORPP|nr:Acetate kinase [Porphyridium purpureum]|eukprot:POR1356..scf208_2